MPAITEGNYESDVLVWMTHRDYSLKTITLASGTDYKVGAVLGQITTGGKYTMYTPGATNGSQNVAGILLRNVDATAADQESFIVNDIALIKASGLVFKSGVTEAQQTTAIEALADELNIKTVDEV